MGNTPSIRRSSSNPLSTSLYNPSQSIGSYLANRFEQDLEYVADVAENYVENRGVLGMIEDGVFVASLFLSGGTSGILASAGALVETFGFGAGLIEGVAGITEGIEAVGNISRAFEGFSTGQEIFNTARQVYSGISKVQNAWSIYENLNDAIGQTELQMQSYQSVAPPVLMDGNPDRSFKSVMQPLQKNQLDTKSLGSNIYENIRGVSQNNNFFANTSKPQKQTYLQRFGIPTTTNQSAVKRRMSSYL